MLKAAVLTASLLATSWAGIARADHTETILGAALGGAAGAAIGHAAGSRGDVILWSALGGAAGAAIASSVADPSREVVVRRIYRAHPWAEPVWMPPPRYVVLPPPRVRYILVEDGPRYCRIAIEHRHKHKHHAWDDWDD